MKLKYKSNYTDEEKEQIISIGPVKSGCDVEMPDNITKINAKFCDCTNLETVILSDSITLIEKEAFEYCYKLKNINLSNVERICDWAFHECNSLKEIEFPNSMKFIDDNAFDSCESLEKIIIPSSIEKISYEAFCDCCNLKEAIINAKCELPCDIFSGCNILEKIHITPESYKLSPDFVFEYKDKIEIIKQKTLDELLDEGKSLKEISNIYKNNKEAGIR